MNESYNTNIPLMFSPETIAYTSVCMAYVRRKYKTGLDDLPMACQNLAVYQTEDEHIANCTAAFLEYWRFRETLHLDGESVLKNAKIGLAKKDSEKQFKFLHYKQKIQAMQKK